MQLLEGNGFASLMGNFQEVQTFARVCIEWKGTLLQKGALIKMNRHGWICALIGSDLGSLYRAM